MLALAVALAAAVLIVAVLPFAASTQIVRDRIAQEMSAWSGYRVVVAEGPVIEVWPSFRAILHDVSLSEWGDENGPPVVEAELVEIDLSAMTALRGDVAFSKARFVRPVLRLVAKEGDTYRPALPKSGRMVRAVEIGREAVAANPSQPKLGTLPADGFGTVEFSGGRIVIAEGGGEQEVITSLSGAASWPALNRAGTLDATGIWRGETVTISLSSPQPLLLFAGGNAELNANLKSAPLAGTFIGKTNFRQGFLEGNIRLSSPSLRRALEWSRMHISPGAAIGAFALEARVTGAGQRFSFQDTRLSLGGTPGMGVIDLTVAEGRPIISGTLAFEQLDLRSFISAFTVIPTQGAEPEEIDTSFTDQMNLDLRLSAASATAGPIILTEVAATAQVKGGLAVFDLSDATAFSGTLQAGFRLDRTASGNQAEVRLLGNGLDAAALARAAGVGRFIPQGRASISAVLRGPITDWASLMKSAEGTVTARLESGAIAGLDLPAFLRRMGEGGFFPLSDLGEGSLAVTNAELDARLSNGVARIDKAKVVTPQGVISIGGIVPYVGRGLALSGTVTGAAGAEDRPFFVGGPWSAPFVSPILSGR